MRRLLLSALVLLLPARALAGEDPPAPAPVRIESDRLLFQHVDAPPPAGDTSTGVVCTTSPAAAPVAAPVAAVVAAGAETTLFVPIVLSSAGAGGSFFSTELTFVNRGTSDAAVELLYTSAIEGGTHTATDVVRAGRQRIVPDAIGYLRALGMPIPESGNRGGTLRLKFTGLSSPTDAAVTARTTTPVTEGRAGLAYSAVAQGLTGTSWIVGLRQNDKDRSNVAVMNAGAAAEGNVTLRISVYPGTAGGKATVLPDVVLTPGEFKQYSGILGDAGFTGGYVKVERIAGTAAYWAYGVVNDQKNSDGSYVAPIPDGTGRSKTRGTVPVAVEAGAFTTELVLTNVTTFRRSLTLQFVADAVTATGSTASTTVSVDGGQQLVIPDFVQYLRDQKVAGIGPKGATYAGGLFLEASGDLEGWLVAARTSAPGGGGRYGLFYLATYAGSMLDGNAWVYSLQQDDDDRSNLAIVTSNEFTATNTYKIEVFDGDTGQSAGSMEGIVLPTKKWTQIGTVLRELASGVRQGYAKITRTAGTSTYLVYGVVNDGPEPNTRSGDGAYLSPDRDCVYTVTPTTQVFGWKGGKLTASVSTSTGCLWAAGSGAAWATISKNPTGSGFGSPEITVGENASPLERTTTISVAGRDVTVRQLGNSPGPYDGTWTGTTSQSKPVSFTIDRNELETISMGLDVTIGSCRVSGSFSGSLTTPLAVVDKAFSGSFGVAAGSGSFSMTFSGTLGSSSATGSFKVTTILTGSSLCFLISGPGYSWTATR